MAADIPAETAAESGAESAAESAADRAGDLTGELAAPAGVARGLAGRLATDWLRIIFLAALIAAMTPAWRSVKLMGLDGNALARLCSSTLIPAPAGKAALTPAPAGNEALTTAGREVPPTAPVPGAASR